ncbi:MAG: Ig-like domain-containing protein, partial [Gemmatimonadaceae bacterium]
MRAPKLPQGHPTSPVVTGMFHGFGKVVAVAASTGAAIVSIISALYSYGMVGDPEAHQSFGNYGAAWVRLQPNVDTATAIGDTVYFAATIADKKGSILVGADPTWTTGDSSIAIAQPDGAVIAKGPGTTTVSVVVGSLVATSRLIVKQRVQGVIISSSAGDTALSLLEGGQLRLRARAVDARGFTVSQAGAAWHVDDSTVATMDSTGNLLARAAGRSVVTARIDDKTGYMPIAVVTTAANLDLVGGASQRAAAGRVLPQPIVVRATNRRGQPAAAKTVTFRVAEGVGKADPLTAITDADGRARTAWTLGAIPGRQTLYATVENLDSATVIIAESDPVPANTRVVALVDSVEGQAGSVVADTVAVRVTDSTGRVLQDVPVQWTATNDGSIEALAPRTDSVGVARAVWTLGLRTGRQRARAQVGSGSASHGIPPVTISASALAGKASDIVVVAGDRQKGRAGAALKKAIVIRVVDANGNGVKDVPLVLSLSHGAVADSSPRTDSAGTASIRWTMGRSASTHSLAVHVSGVVRSTDVMGTLVVPGVK